MRPSKLAAVQLLPVRPSVRPVLATNWTTNRMQETRIGVKVTPGTGVVDVKKNSVDGT